jgi:RNA polymerase-binding transcription factor DksA
MTKKKTPKYQAAPPEVSDLNEAKVLIEELWEQLRHYEDKLSTSSKNSSKSPASDSPKDRYERKKMKALVIAIREELKKVTQGINENSHH